MTKSKRGDRPSDHVEIRSADPNDADAQLCLQSYLAELDVLNMPGYVAEDNTVHVDHMRPPTGRLMLAYAGGEPVGCGAITLDAPDIATVKRMWVAPKARGLGIGRLVLLELEACARDLGVQRLRLETRDELHAAVQLYRRFGYREVAPFTDVPWIHRWFEKSMPRSISAHQ